MTALETIIAIILFICVGTVLSILFCDIDEDEYYN